MRAATAILACACLLAQVGCAGDEKTEGSPDPSTEASDPPARPPAGWRTISNGHAGFTISVPRSWLVRKREGATLVRSDDRLLAVTLAADRSEAGRETAAAAYAREAFEALPGFRELRAGTPRPVRRSPYEAQRVDGTGTLRIRKQSQRVSVAAFRRPGRVTYTAVAFAAKLGGRNPHARELDALLASFRARSPRL